MNRNEMNEILEAKRTLYRLLLINPKLSNKEVDIMYELSLDKDIRDILSKASDG